MNASQASPILNFEFSILNCHRIPSQSSQASQGVAFNRITSHAWVVLQILNHEFGRWFFLRWWTLAGGTPAPQRRSFFGVVCLEL
jgi:hypothetical protein